MTEKERSLPPNSDQNSGYNLEDGTNYWTYFEILIRERTIFISTTFITILFSILYVYVDPPTYIAKIGFREPQEIYLSQLPSEIAELRLIEEKKKKSQARTYSTSLKIAKELGIKNNSFGMLNKSWDLKVARETLLGNNPKQTPEINVEIPTLDIPKWYLYGEKALKLEKQAIQSRKTEDVFNEGLIKKELELKLYQNIDLSSIIPEVFILSQPAIKPVQPIRSFRRIIAMGIIIGLILGFITAFLKNSWQVRQEKNVLA